MGLREVPRREWARLRLDHPCDLTDPTDEFGVGLIAAAHGMTVGQAQDLWDTGGEAEVMDAYASALRMARPDHSWATRALDADARLTVEVRLCNAAGIAHGEFLAWPDRDQDLAVAAWLDEAAHCGRCGATAAAMKNPELARIEVEFCAMCGPMNARRKALEDAGTADVMTPRVVRA